MARTATWGILEGIYFSDCIVLAIVMNSPAGHGQSAWRGVAEFLLAMIAAFSFEWLVTMDFAASIAILLPTMFFLILGLIVLKEAWVRISGKPGQHFTPRRATVSRMVGRWVERLRDEVDCVTI